MRLANIKHLRVLMLLMLLQKITHLSRQNKSHRNKIEIGNPELYLHLRNVPVHQILPRQLIRLREMANLKSLLSI
jgi:hypothetical protein